MKEKNEPDENQDQRSNDATTAGLAEKDVRQALALWEPRIVLLDVEVTPGGPTTLLIRVAYRVRVTNNVFNLVYPFYLGMTEGS